jgi:carbonic anhydrase
MSSPRPGPDELLAQNKRWRNEVLEHDPDFFTNLAKGQNPKVPF